MELPYALLFVVFLPYGNFLEIIKNSGIISFSQQITTSFQNISTTEYPGVKWWTFDEISYNTSATNQTNLNTHIQGKHKGVKYACDQCDYQASNQFSLRNHIQSKHENLKYPCNQCDYQGSKDALRFHLRTKHF